MSEFTDKVVLVTGAGRGTGRALAITFGKRGAIVAANDINPISLDETVALITSGGGRAKDYVFDVAKRMPVQAMVKEILDDWGRIDILINHAGVEPHASILDMDEWDWHRTIDVNLGGPFFTMQQVGRVMHELGGGVIVNLCSFAGGSQGLVDRPAYIASMMGLIGLTRQVAREFAAHNIRVNAVCPGGIDAGIVAALPQEEPLMRRLLEELPVGQLVQPEGVVGLVLYLCSDAATDLTGQVIDVGV